jgi:predicted GIY-YIG superfamily endonuclease
MKYFKPQEPRKVYLIESYHNNLIQYKIGVSKNPKKRLKQHKTSNPNDLTLLYEFESNWPFKVESTLKRMYQKQSIDGEWYNLNDNHVNNFLEKCNMIENNFKTIYNNSTLF